MLLHYQRELREHLKQEGGNTDKAASRSKEVSRNPAVGVDTQDYHDFKVLQTCLDAVRKKRIDQEVLGYKETPAEATFDMLWRLFRPGSHVFMKGGFGYPNQKFSG